MTIEFGIRNGTIDTKYAPLAALCYYHQQTGMLALQEQVQIPMKNRCFSAASKLIQVLVSILAGCETLLPGASAVFWDRQAIFCAPIWHTIC